MKRTKTTSSLAREDENTPSPYEEDENHVFSPERGSKSCLDPFEKDENYVFSRERGQKRTKITISPCQNENHVFCCERDENHA